MADDKGSYQTIPFPKNRQPVLDTLQTWAHKHPIHGLLDVDVTTARQSIHDHRARTGESLSFTAFIVSCVGRAVDEHKAVHALRNWRNDLVLFDAVDVTTVIEVSIGDRTFPLNHIIRSANTKTFTQIHQEIRRVQIRTQEQRRRHNQRSRRLFLMLPAFVRRMFYRAMSRNPLWMKQNVGTVALTAIGMFGEGAGWAIPIAVTPLFITIGGIAEKPGIVHGQIAIREYLSLTLTFDHDIVDGAPAARFAARLKELIESASGLLDEDSSKQRYAAAAAMDG
jgi:pyruvate/2-oxoglutarate dehydrogenase complex dihydrolipoamide acyltransferase (E2) component